jgi:GNAT superfamily N-acetyltransferase
MHTEWKRNELIVSTDPARQDVDAIHAYLTRAYWCEGIPREIVERAVQNSLGFGLFDGAAQIGFARVVTDYATYAYLCDVYVMESHRGRGLGKWLIECVMAHPQLQSLRRFNLATRDAHGLYERFGFRPLARPESFMERHQPDIYKSGTTGQQTTKAHESTRM